MSELEVPEGVVVRLDEPLSRHVPCRTGGPCDAYVVVHDPEALGPALALCRDQGWNRTLLGAGSRTVVRDGGLAGAVIRLGTGFVHVTPDETGWWIGAATPLAMLAGLYDHPALAGLAVAPGSVGASVALDEGWGAWIDRVKVHGRGATRERALADVGTRARALFTEVHLLREVADDAAVPGPVDPGSWYEPVEDDHPAALVREVSLSATRLRGVVVPAAAPDRLVNVGGATSSDLALLQRSVVERVHKERGVKLQDRMRWLGRAS